ncbi:MAG: ankyrin repeat domain-containing protein [Campylobacterales bacterium]|nr:ankyrin repeat domain-containing protein [Campylobacterales bacterium]
MNQWIEPLKQNDLKKIKELVQKGNDINDQNESGESVLAYALRSRCEFELLMYLVQNGADIYDTDNEGVSIFDMAITYNNTQMMQYLIDQGLDVNKTQRKSGFTPLMCAACYGRIEAAKLLLKSGADKDASDYKGFTATDFARKMHKNSILKLLDFDPNAPQNTTHAR